MNIGQQIGDWTILEQANQKGLVYWICSCRCGTISHVSERSLRTGKSNRCVTCYRNRNDLTGNIVGKWKVLERAKSLRPSPHMHWRCRCECGQERIIAATNLVRKQTLRCKACYAQEKAPIHPINVAFSHVRGNAAKREIPFEITALEAYAILEKQNFQCSLTGLSLTLRPHCNCSLDRIDSTKGYVKGNIQWVYKPVNNMKWKLTEEEFVRLCRLVVQEADRKLGSA